MTKNTHSLKESDVTTTRFENLVETPSPATRTVAKVCKMPAPAQVPVPKDYLSADDLVREFAVDDDSRAALERGRRWVADAFFADDGDTVRTLRLRKGWSQSQLAKALGTSQSHVARIERGSENLYIGTCRKICSALAIDMNTLDQLLRRQEGLLNHKRIQ